MQNVHVSNSDNAVDETKVVDVEEDTSALFTKEELEDDTSVAASLKGDSAARKKFFATKENRSGRVIPKDVSLPGPFVLSWLHAYGTGDQMAIQADFSNGFISFQDGVYLQLPVGGFKVDLVRVWDGKACKAPFVMSRDVQPSLTIEALSHSEICLHFKRSLKDVLRCQLFPDFGRSGRL